MLENETPESLLKFFTELDPGGQEEECSIHYGCLCVLKKGRRAAEMLVAALQNDPAAAAAPAAPSPPPAPQFLAPPPPSPQLSEALDRALAVVASLREELAAEKKVTASLTGENGRLANENQLAREKIRTLHRQINRLYDTRELSSIQNSLQKNETPAPANAPIDAPADAPSDSAEAAGSELQTADPPADAAADFFMEESAARVTDAPPPAAPPAA